MFRRQSSNWLRPRTLLMEQLEDRLLFDAVPDAAALAEASDTQADPAPEQVQSTVDPAHAQVSHELIIIDPRVANPDQLLSELIADQPGRSFEVQYLNASEDGVEQISRLLESSSFAYDAVHIFTHGQPGQIELGSTWLSPENLAQHAGEIARWGAHLTADADLLFYGCDVAQTAAGVQMLEEISILSGADVAASDDTTGAAALGGNWDLEEHVGSIESATLAAPTWEHSLAQIVVNSGGGLLANGADGIKVRVMDNTQVIVTYKGLDQLYFPGATDANTALFNGIYVAVGNTLVGPQAGGTGIGPYAINDRNWISQGQTSSGTGTTDDPFKVVTTVYGDINSNGSYNADTDVQMVLTLTYANPNSYFTYDVQVNPPTNGATVKYYHVLDTFLSGGDNGPAFSLPQNLAQTNDTVGNPSLVAVRKDPGGPNDSFVGFAEAQGSREFDFWYSAEWAGSGLYGGLDNGGNITNEWDTNNATDNQLGIQYSLGNVSTPQTFSYHLAFGGKSTIDLDADNSSGATGNSYRAAYEIGSGATIGVSDSDLQINNVVGDLNQATILLTGPLVGDSLTVNLAGLPPGITVASQTASQIVLQGLATEAQYEEAIRQIGFTTTSLVQGNRAVSVTTRNEINEVGFASASAILVGFPPILNLDPSNASGGANDGNYVATYTENATPVSLTASNATASDSGELDINRLTVSLTGLVDGAAERVHVGTSIFALNADSTLTTVAVAGVPYNLTVAYTAATSTFQVTRTGGGVVSAAEMQTILRAMAYSHTSETPTGGLRTVSFTATDTTGFESTDRTTSLTVVPVNDPSIIDLNSAASAGDALRNQAVTFTEDGPAVSLASATAAVSDIGEADITLMNIVATGLADGAFETLTMGGAAFILDANSASTITVGGTTFDITYVASTGTFSIQNNAGAAVPMDPADLTTLIRSITYQNTDQDPTGSSRTFTFTATDSGNVASVAAVSTVTIVAVNDAPVAADNPIAVSEDQVAATSGNVITDNNGAGVDSDAENSVLSVTQVSSTNVVGATSILGTYGTLVISPSGAYSYTVDTNNPTVNGLTTGQTLTETFAYTITDTNASPLTSSANLAITINGVNDPAVLNLDPNNTSGGADDGNFVTSFSESTGPVSISASPLANAATLADPDNTTLSNLTLSVSGLVDGNREKLLIGGTAISLVTSGTQQVTENGEQFDVDVTLAAGVATVIITPGGAPLSALLTDFRDVLRSIEYQNTSVEATHGDRVLSISAVDAGGATSNTVTSTVHVLNQFTAPSSVTGPEDQVGGIGLGIVNSVATSPFIINLGSAPAGTTLSTGTDLGGGLWSVPAASVGTLTVRPPANYSGSFGVTVSNGLESEPITVLVTPVADTPILSTIDAEDDEDSPGVSLAGHIIATLGDTDGSETLTLQIGSIPAGYTLTDGTHTYTAPADGSTTSITGWNLATLFFVPPLNGNGEITLSVLATATESNGTTATNPDSITVTIYPVNDPPAFTDLTPSVTFTETQVNGGPQLIDTNVTVSDVDSANFGGGSLTVAYTVGGGATDALSIRHQGTAAGQIGFDGTSVTYGGVVIGTVIPAQNGTAGSPLIVSFNTNATPAAVEALIENLTYANSSDTPAASRTIQVTINDGGTENATASASTVINVTAVNDPPAISVLNGTTLAHTEGDGAVAIDAGSVAVVVDPDSTDFASGHLLVQIAAGGTASEDVLAIQIQGTGPGQISIQNGNEVTYGGVVIGLISGTNNGTGGNPLEVAFNGNASPAAVQALVRTVSYENIDEETPTPGARQIDFTVTDGDGGTSNTASVLLTVSAVNDAPEVLDLNNVTFTESQVNGGPQLVDIAVTVVDVDSANLAGGTLTISYDVGDAGSGDDQLSFRDQGTGAGLIGFSGSSITFGGVLIGTVRAGFNGSNCSQLIIDFNASATPGAVDALLQNMTYRNADDTPAATRTISVVLTDGDGGTSAAATSQITITAENDAPVLSATGSSTYTQNRPVVVVAPTVTVTDTDDTLLESATVTISSIDRTHDLLTLTAAGQSAATTAGITITAYNPATGMLLLSGPATLAEYEAVLAGVQFSSSSGVPTDRTVSFVVNDGTDNSNVASVTVDYTADTIAPNQPVIASISNDTGVSGSDGITSDNTLTMSGTAEPDSTLELFLDGVSVGTVAVDGAGNWTLDHTGTTLLDGLYVLTATSTDAAGNTSLLSNPFALVVDTNTGSGVLVQGPIIAGISLDSGSSGTDGITSDNTLVIRGTAQPNSSLELFLDGASIGVVSVDSAGLWSLDYTGTVLPDGEYEVTATQTDPAGNAATSPIFTAVIDTTNPSVPTVNAISVDSGSSSTDGFTNDNTLIFSGTAEPNSSVEVFLGGVSMGTVTADGTGLWSLDYTATVLADGVYNVTATSTDAAGNTSAPSAAFVATVDTNTGTGTLAALPVVTTISNDTGASSTDAITSDNTLEFSGTGQPNSVLELFLDGMSIGTTTIDGAGDWTFDYTGTTLADGVYVLTGEQTDPAGNMTTSAPRSITVDSVAPAIPTVQTQITNDQTPTITGTWDQATATGLEVTVNGVTFILGSAPQLTTDGSGLWTLNMNGQPLLPEAIYEVSVQTRDAAGNTSGDLTANELTVDITPPSKPTVNVLFTNDVNPTITGTWAAGDATILQVTVNGYTYRRDLNDLLTSDAALVANPDGTWTLELDDEPALLPGRYNVAATNWDPANNPSSDTTTGEVTIDVTAPLAAVNPPDMTSATDSGSSSTDDLTLNTTPTFTGIGGEPGSIATIYAQPVDESGDPVGPPVAIGTATTGPTGLYSVPTDPGHPLADGPYLVTVTFTDRAGNESDPSPGLAIIIDTTEPLNLLITNADTSTIEEDQVVNLAESPDVTIAGSGAEPTSTVSVVITDSLGTTLGPITTTVNDDGTWSIPDQSFSGMADGPVIVVATETDSAGNVGPGVSTTLTLDRTPPVAPPLVDLTNASDSGASPTDDLTNVQMPTFTAPLGSGVAGDVVTIYIDGELVATGVVAGDGSYEVALTAPLTEGPHDVTASFTDPAGNEGPQSPILAIVIDITEPNLLAIDAPVMEDDFSNADEAPVTVVSGTGVEPTSTVEVTFSDSLGNSVGPVAATVNLDGTWTIPPTDITSLVDGLITVSAVETDRAGNVGDPVTSGFTLDTTPPETATLAPNLTAPTDTGVSNTDDNTANIAPTFDAPAGTGEPGSTVTLYVTPLDADGNPMGGPLAVGTAIVDEDGSYVVSVGPVGPLADGPYDVTVTFTDIAGNEGPQSPALAIIIDTTEPVAALIAPNLIDASDSGTSNTDDLTSNTTPTFNAPAGTGEPGSTVTLYIDGEPVGTATVDEDGSYAVSVEPGNLLADGPHDVTVTFTDAAGNESDPSPELPIVVDTTGPLNLLIANAATSTIEGDHVVNLVESPDVTIAGSGAELTSSVLVVITDSLGNELGPIAATVHEDGTWTIPDQDFSSLADGPILVVATEVDAAGNEGPGVSTTLTLDRTPPMAPPLVDLTDDTDTGSSSTDDLTNDSTPTFMAPPGTGVPGDLVTIFVDGEPAGTGVVAEDGSYTITLTSSLAEGPHAVTASFTDPAGNEGPASPILSIEIDTTAPNSLAIDGPVTSDNVVNIAEQPLVSISGTGAEPGSTVTVTLTDDEGNELGPISDTVNEDGTWSIPPTDISSLVDGPITIAATETDDAGNVGEPRTSTFTLDSTPPTAAANAPNLVDASDSGPDSEDDLTNVTTPTLDGPAGSGEPGSTVTLYVDGQPVGTAIVHEDGSYEVTVDPDNSLTDGVHELTVAFTDLAGNEGPQSPVLEITVDTTAPDGLAIGGPVTPDNVVNAVEQTGVVISGTGVEPTSTITVTLTDSEGNEVGPVTAIVHEDGSWSIPPTDLTSLVDGPITITATETDQAGNTGEPMSSAFDKDTTPPQALTAPDLVDESDTGDTSTDNLTNDNTPTFSGPAGSGEPGSTVTLYVDGEPVGTAIVQEDGSYEVDVPTDGPLLDGEHQVTVTFTDVAGNEGPQSPALAITVDTMVPVTPTTTQTLPDKLTGTGEPGTKITILDKNGEPVVDTNGNPIVTTVGIDGTWTLTGMSPLLGFQDPITVISTDGAGNFSSASVKIAFFAFDSFNNLSQTPSRFMTEAWSNSEILLSRLLLDLGSSPILAGSARPGTLLVARLYSVDGSILAEESVVADAAGNWMVQLPGLLPSDAPRIVIEHISNGQVPLGSSGFRLSSQTYTQLQFGTAYGYESTADGLLGETAGEALRADHAENLNPLNWL